MSYQLQVRSGDATGSDPLARAAIAAARVGLTARAEGGRVRADGGGFAIEPAAGGTMLSAAVDRGEGDERLMEALALDLAGRTGEVIDRHTGRHWPVALLDEWLGVTGLLSGRALAVNEERIAHAVERVALRGFDARVDPLSHHARSERASRALRERLHEELAHYTSRPLLGTTVARALAGLGDFAPLEALTHRPAADEASAAFAMAAEFGAAAVPFFERALDADDPNRRRAAVRALHRVRDPAVLPLVVRALGDRRSTVREAMLESDLAALLALPGARAVLDPVLDRLLHDSSSVVRRRAAGLRRS